MHRVDAHCHWCGEMKSGFSLPQLNGNVLRSAAALALMLTTAGAVWRYAPELREAASRVNASGSSRAALSAGSNATIAAIGSAAGDQLPVAGAAADSAAVQSATAVPDSMLLAAGGMASATLDDAAEREIRWVPAVARTWVNVRSDASRGGQVVGVIKPSSRAMLGTDRAGWRQVRSPDVSGWVDPRLFEADSLRTRGE